MKQKNIWNFATSYQMNKLIDVYGVPRSVTVTVVGNRHGDQSSNPGQKYWIYHIANTLKKGMNSNYFPSNH